MPDDTQPDDHANQCAGWDLVHRDWSLRQRERRSGPGGRPRRRRLVDALHAVAQGVARLLLRTGLAAG